MAGKIDFLLSGGNYLYPITLTDAVYLSDGNLLTTKLNNFQTQIDGKQPKGSYALSNHDHTSISGNAATATVLQNSHYLTVGKNTKWFNGGQNLSYTLDEIGAISDNVVPIDTNINTVLKSGIYRLNKGHIPNDITVDWSQMLVLQAGGDTVGQLIIPYIDSIPMQFRGGNIIGNTNGAWSSWRKVFDYPKYNPSKISSSSPDSISLWAW